MRNVEGCHRSLKISFKGKQILYTLQAVFWYQMLWRKWAIHDLIMALHIAPNTGKNEKKKYYQLPSAPWAPSWSLHFQSSPLTTLAPMTICLSTWVLISLLCLLSCCSASLAALPKIFKRACSHFFEQFPFSHFWV